MIKKVRLLLGPTLGSAKEMLKDMIPSKENENGQLIVSGRDLHELLESKERYSKWIARMMIYGFEDGADFTYSQKSTVVNNGAVRELEDHQLTLSMAKEIAMLQRNKKGRQVRQYFLDLERKWNSPEMLMERAMTYVNAQVEKLENRRSGINL